MNPLQERIAGALGVTAEVEELRSTIETKDEEYRSTTEMRDAEHQAAYVDLNRRFESASSDLRLLERAVEDLDYTNLYNTTQIQEILPSATRLNTIRRLRQMRHENPLAKQGIRLIVRFTLGKGINWICKNDQIRETLSEFWEDPDNQVVLTTLDAQKEFIDETATDGEKFLACFEAPQAAPFLKLAEIPMEEIADIIYDPDNRRVPVYYKRKFKELIYDGEKERYEPKKSRERKDKILFYRDYRVTDERIKEIDDRVKIPAAKLAKEDGKEIKMFHAYVNPLWTEKGRRGISELFASREWFRVYREFMQDRAIINRAATAVAYRRKIKGGPAAVAQLTGTLGGIPVGQGDDTSLGDTRTLTRPLTGATYDSNEAVDLDWMKTDTGAQNAKEDGRALLMVGGAGIGTNIHYFGEGGDANLATAQAMELPMVKNYEDWQTWFASVNMAIFAYVLRLAYGDKIPFEDRSVEAVGDIPDKIVSNTRPLTITKEKNGNGEIPHPLADVQVNVPEPKKTTVADVVSWDFPPIITKDVVKHMTAWAQLTNQVAPGDLIVKEQAIKGALTVLGVPNVDQLMDKIKLEELRLEAQRQAQRDAMMQNLNGGPPEPDTSGKPQNGQGGVPGWTKAGSGADSQTKRLAKGKPEGAKVGRVAADRRPGVS